MSAQPVDLEQISADLQEVQEAALKNPDLSLMVALYGLQLSLAMAQDTRRQADATVALAKELHALRRKS